MKILMAGFLAFTGVAFAADLAPVSYHDGTLTAQSLSDDHQAQYMVRSEGILYALTPVNSTRGNIAQKATLGWSKAFSKNSSLYHQPPGTLLQLRDDGRHLFVKVGNHESMYTAIEVH
jgi:hypothetical protein